MSANTAELHRRAANLGNATALGLTLPPTLLARADEVIEQATLPSNWPRLSDADSEDRH